MDIECPNCHKEYEIEHDYFPENACDEREYECDFCGKDLLIGWEASATARVLKATTT